MSEGLNPRIGFTGRPLHDTSDRGTGLPYSVKDGILRINGTEGEDRGRLTREGDRYELELNGRRHAIDAQDVRHIDVQLRGGDDRFELGRRPTTEEMLRNGAAGRRAVPSEGFPANVNVGGGDGDDELRNVSAEHATLDGGAGNNTIANYADHARILGGRGGRDRVANGGEGVTIDYSRADQLSLEQIADRGDIQGTAGADHVRVQGNHNTIGPDLRDSVRFDRDVDGAATFGNRFVNQGRIDALSDAASVKQAYVAALERGAPLPGADVIPAEVASRGLSRQQAHGVLDLLQGLAAEYAAGGDALSALHAGRAQTIYANAVRAAHERR